MLRLLVKLFLIIIATGQLCFASQNFLNSVVFENTDGKSNIILRTDGIAKVKKTVLSNDHITLTFKGIIPSDNMSTIYKNVEGTGKIITENTTNGELKLHILSPKVASANIIFNTPNSAPIYVGERFGHEKFNWILTMLGLAGIILVSTSHRTRNKIKKRELRDREIAFYKAKLPSMNYKPSARCGYAMNTIEKERVLK